MTPGQGVGRKGVRCVGCEGGGGMTALDRKTRNMPSLPKGLLLTTSGSRGQEVPSGLKLIDWRRWRWWGGGGGLGVWMYGKWQGANLYMDNLRL